jgi:carbamoyltransferase
MALASYGKPVFINDFREMIHLLPNGQYTIDNERLEERFGPSRLKDDPFTQHHFNIAYSLQYVLEEVVLELVQWLHKETKEENLCMAGGVALNCVLNARIRDKGPFKNLWVPPSGRTCRSKKQSAKITRCRMLIGALSITMKKLKNFYSGLRFPIAN